VFAIPPLPIFYGTSPGMGDEGCRGSVVAAEACGGKHAGEVLGAGEGFCVFFVKLFHLA